MSRAMIPLLLLSAMAFAQQPASPPVTRLCVANIHNETKLEVEMPKLRDLLVSQIKHGNLARNSRLEVLPLTEDAEEKAAPEVREQRCDFAVYERLMLFKVPALPKTDSNTAVFHTGPTQTTEQQIVPGIQFTVVRVQSGMPILIDRRAATKPYNAERDILLLLQPVGDRIQTELEKRLLAPAKPGI